MIGKSLFDKLPMTITHYSCQVCGKWHRKGSKKFIAHYNNNFDENNNRIKYGGHNGTD